MSYYCTRSSRARVERVSSASRARASVNLWVDGTVYTSIQSLKNESQEQMGTYRWHRGKWAASDIHKGKFF